MKMELKDTVDLMLSDDFRDRLVAEYHQADIRLKRLIKCLDAYKHKKEAHEHLLRFLPKLTEYRNAVKESCEFCNIKL